MPRERSGAGSDELKGAQEEGGEKVSQFISQRKTERGEGGGGNRSERAENEYWPKQQFHSKNGTMGKVACEETGLTIPAKRCGNKIQPARELRLAMG